MSRCPQRPSPSTTDLANQRSTPPEKVGVPPEKAVEPEVNAIPLDEMVAVERLRIKLKTWFGRFHVEREIYKRGRR